MTEENYDKDIIIKILDKAKEFRDLSTKSQSAFNDANSTSFDSNMSDHLVKTGRVVQELFELLDEFDATEGRSSYLKD